MNKKGFTLIELLVVIGILGLLAGLVTVNVLKIYDRQKGKIGTQEKKIIEKGVNQILSIIDDCDQELDIELLNSIGYSTCEEARAAINSSSGYIMTLGDLKSTGYLSGGNFENYRGFVKITSTGGKYDIDTTNLVSTLSISSKKAYINLLKAKNKINANTDAETIIFEYGNSTGSEVQLSASEEKIYFRKEDKTLYFTSKAQIYASSLKELFKDKTNIKNIYFINFDTSEVTNMESMFYNCSNLKTIYVSNEFTVSGVSNSNNMFNGCKNLKGGAGTTYEDSNPKDKTYARIDGGTTNKGYFTER